MSSKSSRRNFLKRAGTLALGASGLARAARAAASAPTGDRSAPAEALPGGPESSGAHPLASAWPPPVGYATISWPQAQFTEALKTISNLGFCGVQMLGWVRDSYSGDLEPLLEKQLTALKLEPAVLSCSRLRLDPARPDDQTAEFRAYAAFLQKLGGKYLQIMDGGRPGREYTAEQIASLGARMNALGKLAREYGLTAGYHPHFGTLGETREGLGKVLAATDAGDVKLIADVAHLQLGGSDPVEVIKTYRNRVMVFHFKDLRKDAAEAALENRDSARHLKYHFCEIGRGVVDFPRVVEAVRGVAQPFWIIVELDAYELPPGGPAESARINQEALAKLGVI